MNATTARPADEPAPGDDAVLRVRDLLARADGLTNRAPLQGDELALEALALARELGRASDEAYALLMHSRCKLSLSAYADVQTAARAALAIFEELNDLYGQARSTMMLANVQVHLSDFPEAAYLHERALELAIAAGDPMLITMIRGNLTMVEADIGNWRQALEIARANSAANAATPHADMRGGLLRCEAYARLAAGLTLIDQGARADAVPHLERAVELAQEALAIYTELATVRYQRSSLVIMAEAYCALGNEAGAVQAARSVLQSPGQEMPRAAVAAQMVLGSVAERAGRHAEAAELLDAALRMSELEADGLLTTRILRLLSEVHEALGSGALALQFSRRAALLQQRMGDEAMRRRARMLEDRRKREHAEGETARHIRMLGEKEAQLNHANRLAAAGEMLSVITHEMTQPLSAIMSYTETCLTWLEDGDVDLEQLRDALTSTCAETVRASEAIKRLRNFMSRRPPQLAPVDLGRAVQDTLQIMHPGVRNHRVRVATQLEARLPRVKADEILLVQVLTNLVRNALEAMAEVDERDRKLEIVTRRTETGHIAVEVADSGTGFEPGAGEKLFDPFYSTKASGMGLGLAISRSIAQSFGGQLAAAGREPRGALFTLTLDIA